MDIQGDNTSNTADTLQKCAGDPHTNNMGVVSTTVRDTGGVSAQVDYMNLTAWAPLERVQEVALYQLTYHKEDFSDEFKFIQDTGARLARIGPYGHIKEFWAAGGQRAEYVQLSYPGASCELLGHLGLWNTIRELGYLGRVKGSRLDVKFDGVPFDVEMFYRAVKEGQLVSKHFRADSVSWMENKEGRTCYLGNPKSERFIRVYDRRGPVRMEFELSDDVASNYVNALYQAGHENWSTLLASWVLQSLDFRMSNGGVRNKQRRERVSWWQNFLDGRTIHVEPKTPAKVKRLTTYIGEFEYMLKKNAASIVAFREYVGEERFWQCLRELAGESVSENIRKFSDEDFWGWKYGKRKSETPF